MTLLFCVYILKYSIDFVRIGGFDRIHPIIQKYESNNLMENIKSVAEMRAFFEKKVR